MAENYLILGGSGHAKVIIDIIKQNFPEKDIVILDDSEECALSKQYGIKGSINACMKYKNNPAIIAIGNNNIRSDIAKKYDLNYATLIHKSAIISPDAEIGEGTVVMPGAVINSGAVIGKHCIINSGAIVEHDCIIGDYVHISPGAHLGGTVKVGKCAWIGLGANVINNICIGEDTIVGSGATVIKDIQDDCTAVGCPAKPINTLAR